MAVNIGLDLCDDNITGYIFEKKKLLTVPAVVCREKKDDLWYIGESAYRLALSGKGVLTDKLLSLLRKGGTSTIARQAYTAEQLIAKLIAALLWQLLDGAALSSIDRLVISLHHTDKTVMDSVIKAAEAAGVNRDAISIISHSDAFVYYTLSQTKDMYANMTALFDLSDEQLSFYRMKAVRGISRNSIVVEGNDLEENFRIGILKKEAGSELGDRIMTEAAKKCIGNDIFSAVILTGKGFERTDWAKSFISFVCRKRRVIYEDGLFAIGAAIHAEELTEGREQQYLIFSDTSLAAEISTQVSIADHESKLVLVPAGHHWYGSKAYAELLPHDQDYIDIDIVPVDKFKGRKTVRMTLDSFEKRPDRCTKVSLGIEFEDQERMKITVCDLGFGELFPSDGSSITETVELFS